jgi:hypothetical protein
MLENLFLETMTANIIGDAAQEYIETGSNSIMDTITDILDVQTEGNTELLMHTLMHDQDIIFDTFLHCFEEFGVLDQYQEFIEQDSSYDRVTDYVQSFLDSLIDACTEEPVSAELSA